MDLVKEFRELFRGRTDAWGSVEGRSNKEKVTAKHYEKHLKGEVSLGVYMLQDDATSWFFAVDLDEKDIAKALAIRKGFGDLGIPVYVAFSKGKGFHIYGFAEKEPFNAGEARVLCHSVLSKLGISAEVFPKQAELDKTITTLGNYINLPCFGKTRMFITTSKTPVPLKDAVQRIRRIPQAKMVSALKKIPPPVQPNIQKVKGKTRSRTKHAPCVGEMLKGVTAGARDVAAFALARHYLDQQYMPEEVLGLLQVWDANNRPPMNDPGLLEVKVKSAMKGYQFGCSSVTEEPLLANYCIGINVCPWLRTANADRKKKGLLREQSFYETETHIYEEIIQNGKALFVVYEKSSKAISYQESVDFPEFSIIPIYSAEITEGAVTIPTGIEPYGDTVTLKNDVRSCIETYVDIKNTDDREFASWYILLSWVFDKLTTISYLHFMGDTGCGKSRALDVIGRLCYKPLMMAGAVTPAPIYRLIKRFRGTLILEEADFKDTTEKGEVITILNCGFERNRPVIRCSQDNPDNLQILPCYGPKVFATRYDFQDVALAARCMKFEMEETDREDIPALLGTTFQKRAEILRNKLLLWRLENLNKVDPDVVEEIELGKLEPRLKQIGLPFAIPFKDYPDVMEDFRRFMQLKQEAIIVQRAESEDGQVVLALFKAAEASGKDYITSTIIAKILNDELKVDRNNRSVGRSLASLHILRTKRRSPTGNQARYLRWEPELMRKLLRRYIPEPEDYQDLFKEEVDVEV